MKNWQADTLFACLLVGIYFLFGFHQFLFSPPQGIHFMRQTDGLALAENYFRFGNPLLEPELLSVRWANGKAANEFPILYFITARLYTLFGTGPQWLRGITLLIFSLGIVSLQRFSFLLFRSRAYSFSSALFILCSTILIYYSCNFLPDAAAFGFTLGGLFFWLNGQHKKSLAWAVGSFLLFSLAGLLKVTMLIYPIAITVTAIVSRLFKWKGILRIDSVWRTLISALPAITIVGLWNMYMINYNISSGSHAFLSSPLPIWDYNRAFITMVWDLMSNYWAPFVLPVTIRHILISVVVFQLIMLRFADKQLTLLTAICSLGSVAYTLLFFAQFEDHDYYFIVIMPTLILLLTNGLMTLRNMLPKFTDSLFIKTLLVLFVASGIHYSSKKIAKRYVPMEVTDFSKQLEGVETDLDKFNVGTNARFLVLGDFTPNGSLYFLGRKGLSIKNPSEYDTISKEKWNQFSMNYLLVINSKWSWPLPTNIVDREICSNHRYGIYQLKEKN